MDDDASSPRNGEVSPHQESDLNLYIAERFNPATRPDESGQERMPKNGTSRASVSVTARWRKRVSEVEKLEEMMQQWLQKERPEMPELECLAEVECGLKCSTRSNTKCKRTLCKAFAGLKETCQSFLDKKKMYAEAMEKLHVAEMNLAEAKDRLSEFGPPTISQHVGMTLEEQVASRNETVAARNETVALSNDAVASCSKDVANAASMMLMGVRLIANEHNVVKCLLGSLKIAGNDASVVSARESKTASNDPKLNDDKFHPEEFSPTMFDKLCDPNEVGLDDVCFLPRLARRQHIPLAAFYTRLKLGFGQASILNDDDKEYNEKCIKETVKGIIGYNVNESIDQSTTSFYSPGCEGQEKKGVQPILYAIMVKMVQLVGHGKHITREQGIPKVENRKARFVDFVVNFLGEYFLAILPAMLGVPIEVKPITRKQKTVEQLLLESQNQVIGHLAKQAMFAFDHGGIGGDCRFFGLQLTMGSVAVIVLELSGVGTADVKVTARRSKRAPLFDKETREHLFGQRARDVEASLEDLEDQHGMPAGFCLLARTIISVQSEVGNSLFARKGSHPGRFSIRSMPPSVTIGRYLGSGSYSNVVKLNIKGRNDVFAKVPKSYRMQKALQSEVRVLKELRGHACIPELFDPKDAVKTLDIYIRCEVSELACLPLKGLIGKSTNRDHSPWKSCNLETVFNKVYDALKYAHKKHWAHLDVRPANIITSVNVSKLSFEVMLIDWGCAYRNDRKLKGYVGCPPYTHDDLFGLTKSWKPHMDHDLASLVYSMAELSHGSVSWSGFSNHHAVADDDMDDRRDKVREIWTPLLKDWKLSCDDKKAILKSICRRERETRKRKRVDTNQQNPSKRRAIDRSEPSRGVSGHNPIRPSRSASRGRRRK